MKFIEVQQQNKKDKKSKRKEKNKLKLSIDMIVENIALWTSFLTISTVMPLFFTLLLSLLHVLHEFCVAIAECSYQLVFHAKFRADHNCIKRWYH